ncbi:post-transcriptional regulator [Bacillus salitolerans]|uniref:Post-transcriptional regulator n=1 Tax=Bacillus salitolerans TaxID=1437434 RepID=A0ABW4LLK7_9BACI
MNWDELKIHVEPAIVSKLEEFKILGYDKVNEEDIWNCLRKKKWKKDEEPKPLREVVNDILSLSISDYMSFITVEAYKGPSFFSS